MKKTFKQCLSAFGAALLVTLLTGGAWAQSNEEITVSEQAQPSLWRWDRAGVVDYSLIGGSAVTILVSRLLGPAENRWSGGGTLADEAVRDRLLLSSRNAQHAIADVSDLTLSAVTAMPMADATIVAYGYYDDPVLSRELAILSVEVAAVLSAMQTVFNSVAGRERPYGRRCGNDLRADLDGCSGRARHYSFFSGHTSQAFAAATLTCSIHARLNLFGKGLNTLPCVASLALAAFTGSARIMADKHYLTDVMAGAFVGTLTGLAIPYLRFRSERKSAVRILPTANGLQIVGEL